MARDGAERRPIPTVAELDRRERWLGRSHVPSLTDRAPGRCRHCGVGLWKSGPPVCTRPECVESR